MITTPRGTSEGARPGRRTLLSRALRLRCPRCGHSRLFAGWFKMHTRCNQCGLDFHREPGFYLGSIYVNYGLTALAVTAGYIVGTFKLGWPANWVLAATVAFCVVFPLWFFRYARSIWLAFDELWDPQPQKPAATNDV